MFHRTQDREFLLFHFQDGEIILDGNGNSFDNHIQEIINSADNNGSLPLNLAIESNNLEMMEILIKEGARVSEETIYAAAR